MKTKKIEKPLELKKQTIANLGLNAMEKVKGGACTLYPTGCTEQQICCTIFMRFSCAETYYTCPTIAPCIELTTER